VDSPLIRLCGRPQFASRVALLIAVWQRANPPHNVLNVNFLQLFEVQRSLRKPFASNPDPLV
jgi:hypothetical protein